MEMDEELTRDYRRWLEAEHIGTDDEADAACRAVFQAADREEAVPLTFTGTTMAGIAAEAARDARRAKQTRRALTAGGVAAGAVAAYFGAGPAVSVLSMALVAVFDLLIGLIVNGAAGIQAGADLWSLAGSMARAASAFVADPKVTFVLLVLQGLAIAALVTLQRLLGSDGESFK
jgi:hypothetical protein